MIRILHLTDFHLNIKTLKDWNDFYRKAFFEKLEELHEECHIDLILFTGDMIDKAGEEFGSVTEGLNKFKTEIILPIIEKLNIDVSRFIICPGNHDINRSADKQFTEEGLKNYLTTSDNINNFINQPENDYEGIQRIKEYKEFEYSLYKDVENKKQSKFNFALTLEIGNKKVGVASINTSWRCYGTQDYKNILIGESQLNDNYQYIKDCDVKIALLHHQLNWLSEVERTLIDSHISDYFDFIFSGHVHQSETEYTQNLTGSSIRIVAPSGLNQIRQDKTNYVNGFIVVDYGENITCHYLKYNHTQTKFVDNTDVCDKGIHIIDSNSICNKLNAKHAIPLNDADFLEFLNDSGANFTHRSKKLLLDDIYVPPFLEQFSLKEQEEKTNSTSLDAVFNKIVKDSSSNIVFLGEENSGKTSLCKRLYKKLMLLEKVLPIYIKGQDIKKVGELEIKKLINKECRNQYKNDGNLSEYRKVIIIDDFNNCTLPQKSRRNVLKILQLLELQTIVTWDEFFTLSDLLESQTFTLEIYEILKFSVRKRLELIRKWIDLIDEEFQDDKEKEFQVNQLFKVINSIIGKNLVPSLPIYILTILQANELTTDSNFEQSTFGHYYDVLIKSAIGQRISENKEIEKYYSYLTELSYKLYSDENKNITLSEERIIDFHKFFIEKYKLQMSLKITLRILEESNLISEANNLYKFKYKYIYFYFIGKYLSDNIEDEGVKIIVKNLSERLYQTESANIYIFLSHHSKSKFVINQIIERGRELFSDQLIIGFNQDIEHINNLIDQVTENLDFDEGKSPDEHKNDEYFQTDVAEIEINNQQDKYEEIDSISKINKAFKTIEILGYIIKNRYASLKGADKEILVEELYKLGLRSLTFLFKSLLEGEEYIKNEIIDIIRKDPNSTLTTREREGLAKQFMFNLLYMVSYSIFKRISTSLSSKDLEITFKDVKNKLMNIDQNNKNNAVSLIDMAIIFEYSKIFPASSVNHLAKEFKNNPLAFNILRRLGINFMRMMPMEEIEQQKASEMLNISMKRQRAISGSSNIRKN